MAAFQTPLAVANRDDSVLTGETNGKLSDRSTRLSELIARLPEHERWVIGLRHFEGYSVKDISQITGRPVGTVTKQLSRAHQSLRRWLEKEERS